MSAVQAYVTTFRLGTTTGTQTISGIVDRDGHAFEPVHIMFIGGTGQLETLWSNGSGLYNSVSVDTGWYNATDGKVYTSSIAELPQFSSKIVSGSGGGRAYSSLEANAFFGGDVYRLCSVTATRVGEFDLETTFNDGYFAVDIMCVCLGGADLDVEMLDFSGGSGNKATSFESKGLLNREMTQAAAGSVLTSIGGGLGHGVGFDTPSGGGYGAHGLIQNQGGNYRVQSAGPGAMDINPTTGAAINGCTVTAWTPSYLAVTAGSQLTPMSFGGATVVCNSGTVRANTTTGEQIIDLGIDARFVYLVGTGTTNAASTDSAWVEMCESWIAGHRYASNWWGESRTGNSTPLYGASYISNTSLLRFADSAGPKGSATAFGAVAEFDSLSANGQLIVNWTVADGTQRDLLWFALGEIAVPYVPPSYTTVPLVERRLRQAPHIVSELNRQFISKFQIHLQPGIGQGAGQGADPMVMFQYSKDGGHTWSNERLLPAGKVGQYARRCIAWRLGVGRDWVFRVSVTDPNVPWALVAAYLDGSEGVN